MTLLKIELLRKRNSQQIKKMTPADCLKLKMYVKKKIIKPIEVAFVKIINSLTIQSFCFDLHLLHYLYLISEL
jgi:hypothetical protein